MKTTYIVCGHCGGKMKQGDRYFGPAQVKCGRCGTVMRSGYREWSALSTGGRLLGAFLELLCPSFLATTSPLLRMLVTGFVVMFIYVVVTHNAIEQHIIRPASAPWLGSLAVGLYFLLLLTRLFFLVRESNRYTKTGVPPVWKH
jgi:hypothetical protein